MAGTAATAALSAVPSEAQDAPASAAAAPPATVPVMLEVNGQRRTQEVDTRTTLLDLLRE
ncbi:MAG: aldehyde dehydrogenase iron-sulfur subunit, partial [Sphingomonadales bacterium]|nr:aldehyde dehydrogenase iron-sulfur subunit [Sphingomonadales bacterium]